MDGSGWTTILLGVMALLAMIAIGFTAGLVHIVGRSAGRSRAETDERGDRAHRLRTVRDLLDAQRSWFAALDVATILAAVIATGLLATVFGAFAGSAGTLLAILVVVLVYLTFVQALPVALARSRPNRSGKLSTGLAGPIGALFRPIAIVVQALAEFLDRLIPNASDEPVNEGPEDEIRNYIASEEDAVIQPVERQMIDGVLHLEDIRVRELMVPRVDIVAVDRMTSGREIVDLIVKAGHSRIPVYEESIDHVIGVLYAKDLLPFVIGNTDALPLISLLRPPYVVPETKRVNELLAELRSQRVHLAIVADEYGGTAGIISIEDILEEIVGEIQDEYDKEMPLFQVSGPDELVADGRLAVEDAEDALGLTFEEDDYDSLGGFVQKHLGRLPQDGDEFEAEGVSVLIMEVERHRVRKMRVRRVRESDLDDAAGQGAIEELPVVPVVPDRTEARP
ncbi:MAG: Hemolysins and related proteins containing CBS domains [uncultured Thermomicrobiales bacterium]|uniref:Hemolysins and related proteins containing CBS domains n=1 Tax=uncultured Thermomicrobiales bacterium TaxID=1645740 RepID=A0A6J4UGJ8_9BACT|nr:MAG: Hemolysins and related proteins containing CBS domains [uncultured Thermomicrobiales bacterium]